MVRVTWIAKNDPTNTHGGVTNMAVTRHIGTYGTSGNALFEQDLSKRAYRKNKVIRDMLLRCRTKREFRELMVAAGYSLHAYRVQLRLWSVRQLPEGLWFVSRVTGNPQPPAVLPDALQTQRRMLEQRWSAYCSPGGCDQK